MRAFIVLLLAGACTQSSHDIGPPSGPSPVTAPAPGTYDPLYDTAPNLPDPGQASTVEIDLDACTYGKWFLFFPLGSGRILVHPTTDNEHCEIWFGGESENPNYDGHPTEYCLFDRHATISVQLGAGPVYYDSPQCVTLTAADR